MSSGEFLQLLLRIQFGLSASFHYLFVPLSLGLLLCVCLLQTMHVAKGVPHTARAARYWGRFFVLAWGIGIVTGYPLRWQLHQAWGGYTELASEVFAEIFAIEGYLVLPMFALVAVLAFCRDIIRARWYTLACWLLMALMLLQAWTILSVNAWMQHPVGVAFDPSGWNLISLSDILLSDTALVKLAHTLCAALLLAAFFVLAESARLMASPTHASLARPSWLLATRALVLTVPLIWLTGHASALGVARHQPMKFAAMEAHWQAQDGAGMVLFAVPDEISSGNLYQVSLPYVLGLLTSGDMSAPPGMLDIMSDLRRDASHALQHPHDASSQAWVGMQSGLARAKPLQWAAWTEAQRLDELIRASRPPVVPVFFALRVMVVAAVLLSILSVWAFAWRRRVMSGAAGRLPMLLRCCLPLPWVATVAGWMVAEIGRQPWVVYGQLSVLQTFRAPALDEGVLTMFAMSGAGVLICVACVMALRAIRAADPDAAMLLDGARLLRWVRQWSLLQHR